MSNGENELVRRFKAARRANVPLVTAATPDPAATMRLICAAIEHSPESGEAKKATPKIMWDVVNGVQHLNEDGLAAMATTWGGDASKATKANIMVTLVGAAKLPERSILFIANAHRFMAETPTMQAIWNLRDLFKANKRTLVLLGPAVPIPEELTNDVVDLDEQLPDDAELRAIVRKQWDGKKGLTFARGEEVIGKVAQALKGCSAFGAEQLLWMSTRPDGVDMEDLNRSVQKAIERTAGLVYETGAETFDDIGGLTFAKRFGEQMFAGPRRPALVVRIEELEKAMAGTGGGDSSGTSDDTLQVILSEMEDNDWSGMLAVGPAGSGKSLFSKALARTFGARPIRFDPSACKNKYVGESGRQVRAAMKLIRTIGGQNVFFIASVNRLDGLPPELKRRFRRGLWFFDLPSAEDRKKIWSIQRKRWLIDPKDKSPDSVDLTGADIRNICETAYSQGITLREALAYVVPLKTQDPQSIEAARQQANGRFIDANRGGVYRLDRKEEVSTERSAEMEV